jgi:hypothetical protein
MYGQPSKFCNLVFCENEELSPWESYSVSQGFSPEDSTVLIEEIFYLDGVFQLGHMRMPSGIWTHGFQADLDRIAQKARGNTSALEFAAKNMTKSFAHATFSRDPLQLMRRNYMLILYPDRRASWPRRALPGNLWSDLSATTTGCRGKHRRRSAGEYSEVAESGKVPAYPSAIAPRARSP